MADDFFRDVGTSVFKPIGDFVGGAVTALQPGRVQQMQRRQRDIDLNKHLSILRGNFAPEVKEQSAQAIMQSLNPEILKKMQTAGTNVYQQQTTDPIDQAGKLALAHERLVGAGADEAAGAVMGKINELAGVQGQIDKEEKTATSQTVLADYFSAGLEEMKSKQGRGTLASPKQVDKFEKGFAREAEKQGIPARNAELLFGQLYDTEVAQRKGPLKGMLRNDVLPTRDVIDSRGYFSYELPEAAATKKPREKGATASFDDLLQGATPDFPNDTTPKTFEQIGITNTQDQATLQEMQKALPERDLRQEYQDDPENMKRLMELWRKGKLNKKNLRKAFSVIQAKAKQSLGIA